MQTHPTHIEVREVAQHTHLYARRTLSLKALESLGVVDSLRDHILVQYVSRYLDHSSRESWEISLGSSLGYPTLKKLEEFVNSRARALARIEDTTAQSPAVKTQPARKPATAYQVATNPDSTQSDVRLFYCDCCEGKHFIVMCPKIYTLNVATRRSIASDVRLCYNSLGRHNANSCRTTLRCKQYGTKHHTMLHESGHPQPATVSKTEQTTSTSSSH
ncbi:hypothetical protein M0804_013142 [Polistes exclamans]|nr:hypothetical protein M0804_013142 [Polistes exclamans]